MWKILSIGNSFSHDAQKWLKPIFESMGEEIYNVNLYIGGCPLEAHWHNFKENSAVYDFEVDCIYQKKSSITEALLSEDWDVITFQQASDYSGEPETYMPYLKNLGDEVRKLCPNAKFYIHKTWAYEQDANHPAFVRYHHNQKEMYERLCFAYDEAAKILDCDILPCGDVIQYLRDNCSEFDYPKTGLSLNRDGYHLSEVYGRYAAALTWYGCITGKDVREVPFIPQVEENVSDLATENVLSANDGTETKLHMFKVIKTAVYYILEKQ